MFEDRADNDAADFAEEEKETGMNNVQRNNNAKRKAEKDSFRAHSSDGSLEASIMRETRLVVKAM